MSDEIKKVDGVQKTSAIRQQSLQRERALRKSQLQLLAKEISIGKTLSEAVEDSIFNPFALLKKSKTLEERTKTIDKGGKENLKEEDLVVIENLESIADEYQNRNPEFEQRFLLGIKVVIDPTDGPEEILRKVLKSYPDHYLADEALQFLLETTNDNRRFIENLGIAKALLNERFTREIKAGRNINQEAINFSKTGLGSPGMLRDLYRDVTSAPREAITLFEELTKTFTFEKMSHVVTFFLHSIGADLKSKGPSINRTELSLLLQEVRNMQSIVGIFRFFNERMKLLQAAFKRESWMMPSMLTFDFLAKQYVTILKERYPSPEKVINSIGPLGLSELIAAQIAIITQFRDATRQISPKLFKSEKHRSEILISLIETICELDDLLEEEEEKKKEEEENEEEEEKGWSDKDTME